MKSVLQVLLLIMIFFGCDKASKEESMVEVNETKSDTLILDYESLIDEGFLKLHNEDYLFQSLILSKKEKLKGVKSLSIRGYCAYTFDGRGNILRKEDITNNFSVYSYDKKNRLIEFEVKQHTTQEAYYTESYRYSGQDSVVEIIKISSGENEPVEKEVINENIFLDTEEVRAMHFKSRTAYDHYINKDEGIIITYENKMVFCCGEIMDGKNKLSYYFNENEMIDSLVIEGIESNRRMHFRYEYSY